MAVTTDPVCGVAIDESAAVGSAAYAGQTCYFCSRACQQRFQADPGQHAKRDS